MATKVDEIGTETETSTKSNNELAEKDKKLIADAVGRIRHHQQGIGKATVETITHWIRIGRELNDLHSQIPHGGWEDIVQKEVGLNKSTVQRLRKIADSNLEQQILTMGPDLKIKLSSDVQKLVMLTEIPDGKFTEFFERFNPAKMSRAKVRKAVNEICEKQPDTVGADTARQSRSKKSKTDGSPLRQVIVICEQFKSQLVESVQKELDGGKDNKKVAERARKAIDEAINRLEMLQSALKEKLAA